MKKLILLTLLLLVVPQFVSAESKSFNTTINLTFNNNSVYLAIEGFSINYTNGNLTQEVFHSTNFTRDVSTSINLECDSATLSNISRTNILLSETLKDSQAYYDLYISCFGNLSGVSSKLDFCEGKPNYETEFGDCESTLVLTQAEKKMVELVNSQQINETGTWRQNYDLERAKVEALITDNNDLSNQRFLALAIGPALMLGWKYYAKRRKEERPEEEEIFE